MRGREPRRRARASRRTGLGMAVVLMGAGSAAAAEAQRFHFGGYGRLSASTDLDGGRGRPTPIVAVGPRLNETSYLELDFGYLAYAAPDARVSTVVTLALGDQLFHYDGRFDAAAAIRNAYLHVDDLYAPGVFAWVGSRMYRGDDVYLLDFWPLDNLNTVGAGGGWRSRATDVALQVGVNRLEDDFQVQSVAVPGLRFGTAAAEFLDRQRGIVSVKGEQRFGGGDGELGLKLKLYGELHHLPSGRRALAGSFTETEPLSDDLGWLLGAEVGLWNFGRNGHLNLFLRYATGLAAYGELVEPVGLDTARRAVDAREYRVALSGNFETSLFGVLYGGLGRVFTDADGEEEDFDDRVEGTFVVRPALFLTRYFTPMVEASVQVSRANGLNPRTQEQAVATVTQLALLPTLTFSDEPGMYARPQMRLIYSVSLLNDAALAYHPAADPRSRQDVVHFLGVGAEWWYGRGGGY